MLVPYFRARDLNSIQMVEGFYTNFPETEDADAPLVHALMIPTPIEEPPLNLVINTGEEEIEVPEPPKKNTLMYCTIEISTLEKIKDVEIGE
jgi:hypothetical protein